MLKIDTGKLFRCLKETLEDMEKSNEENNELRRIVIMLETNNIDYSELKEKAIRTLLNIYEDAYYNAYQVELIEKNVANFSQLVVGAKNMTEAIPVEFC
jgi:cell shape-determining protein MreC